MPEPVRARQVIQKCNRDGPRAVRGGRARRVSPSVRFARLTSRGPSAPTTARLWPRLARHPRLPAPSRSLCRAAAAAVEGLEEGLAHRAAESPADPLPPAATAEAVVVVLAVDETPPGTCEE